MDEDRRTVPRATVNLPASWEGVLAHDKASVTDLSLTGCFILTGGKVDQNELIWIEINLPNEEKPIHFWAEVEDVADEIGFAVKFTSSGDDDRQRLAAYMQQVLDKETS